MLYHISSQHCFQYNSLLVDRHCQGNDETKVNKGEQWEHLVRIMLEMMIAMMMMIVVMMIAVMLMMANYQSLTTKIFNFISVRLLLSASPK